MSSDTSTLRIAYGTDRVEATVPGGKCLGTLDILNAPALPNRDVDIRNAFEHPVELDTPIFDLPQAGESISIIVSDSFRQTRADQFLPVLFEGFRERGISDTQLSITFSTGTHRPPTPDEQRDILGEEIYQRLEGRLFNHDPRDEDNLIYLGETRRGTPVEINRRVHESDRIITTGAVVFHYFGGFGGGRKSIVPGLASVRTIAHNHTLNLDRDSDRLNPSVRIGALTGNPVAEDMLEATRMTHVDAAICTVLNAQSEIAAIFAGELEEAHLTTADFAAQLYSCPIREQADIVIAASPGTKNFIQTHKALFNAFLALKPDGKILLLAPCPEGLGGEQFEKWLQLGGPAEIIAQLRRESDINGQTALSTILKAPQTILLTELSESEVVLLGTEKAQTLQDAIDRACDELATSSPTFYIMPSAAFTVPFVQP